MSDEHFCIQMNEIYKVIGRPEFHNRVRTPPDDWFDVWAALGRDYLREKLIQKGYTIQTDSECSMIMDDDGPLIAIFNTENEALINAARAVFMGGK